MRDQFDDGRKRLHCAARTAGTLTIREVPRGSANRTAEDREGSFLYASKRITSERPSDDSVADGTGGFGVTSRG